MFNESPPLHICANFVLSQMYVFTVSSLENLLKLVALLLLSRVFRFSLTPPQSIVLIRVFWKWSNGRFLLLQRRCLFIPPTRNDAVENLTSPTTNYSGFTVDNNVIGLSRPGPLYLLILPSFQQQNFIGWLVLVDFM